MENKVVIKNMVDLIASCKESRKIHGQFSENVEHNGYLTKEFNVKNGNEDILECKKLLIELLIRNHGFFISEEIEQFHLVRMIDFACDNDSYYLTTCMKNRVTLADLLKQNIYLCEFEIRDFVNDILYALESLWEINLIYFGFWPENFVVEYDQATEKRKFFIGSLEYCVSIKDWNSIENKTEGIKITTGFKKCINSFMHLDDFKKLSNPATLQKAYGYALANICYYLLTNHKEDLKKGAKVKDYISNLRNNFTDLSYDFVQFLCDCWDPPIKERLEPDINIIRPPYEKWGFIEIKNSKFLKGETDCLAVVPRVPSKYKFFEDQPHPNVVLKVNPYIKIMAGKRKGKRGEKDVIIKDFDYNPIRIIEKNNKEVIDTDVDAKREVELLQKLKKLNAPNIVKIYDSFLYPSDQNNKVKTKYFSLSIIMKKMEGSLNDYLKVKSETIDFLNDIHKFELSIVAYSVAKALQFTWKNNLVHRDIKLDNILVYGIIKEKCAELYALFITDFNHAKDMSKVKPGEEATLSKGTSEVNPPEMWGKDYLLDEKDKSFSNKFEIYQYGIALAMLYCNIFYDNIRELQKAAVDETVGPAVGENKPIITDEHKIKARKLFSRRIAEKVKAFLSKYPELEKMSDLITNCLKEKGEDRPTSEKVIEILESENEKQIILENFNYDSTKFELINVTSNNIKETWKNVINLRFLNGYHTIPIHRFAYIPEANRNKILIIREKILPDAKTLKEHIKLRAKELGKECKKDNSYIESQIYKDNEKLYIASQLAKTIKFINSRGYAHLDLNDETISIYEPEKSELEKNKNSKILCELKIILKDFRTCDKLQENENSKLKILDRDSNIKINPLFSHPKISFGLKLPNYQKIDLWSLGAILLFIDDPSDAERIICNYKNAPNYKIIDRENFRTYSEFKKIALKCLDFSLENPFDPVNKNEIFEVVNMIKQAQCKLKQRVLHGDNS